MKIRNGFISNSSATSFVVGKNYLTEEQVKKLMKFTHTADLGIQNFELYIIGQFDTFKEKQVINFLKRNNYPLDKIVMSGDQYPETVFINGKKTNTESADYDSPKPIDIAVKERINK